MPKSQWTATCRECDKTFKVPNPYAKHFGSASVARHVRMTGHTKFSVTKPEGDTRSAF